MRRFLNTNAAFLIPYQLFFCVGLLAVVFISKVELQLLMNGWNTPFWDNLFPKITQLGEGIPVALMVLFLLLYNYKKLLHFGAAYLSGGILVILGKHLLFSEIGRPKSVMFSYPDYHWVEGVILRSAHSFPSGHTQTSFTVFFFLACLIPNRFGKFCCFLIAMAAGFSRIYISQHFLVDVVVGSAIAVLSVILWQPYFERLQNPKFRQGLLKRFRYSSS